MTDDLNLSSFVLNMRSKQTKEPVGKNPGIGWALFPKTKRQLLIHFFLSSERRHYFREITRLVKASPGAVQRELATLVDAGILASEKVGRQRYYWADPDCMIYSELKSIVLKSFGAIDTIRSELIRFENDIRIAFIYGSIVDNSDTAKSDIDLMVIGTLSFRKLAGMLNKVETVLNRPINPTLYSTAEFLDKMKKRNHFLHSIFKSEKLFVIGTNDDLVRLAK